MADPARRIRVTPYFQSTPGVPGSGFRVRIEASDGHLIPDAVFAYLLAPASPAESGPPAPRLGWFSHVCSPADLANFPEGEPDPQAEFPYFRLAAVDVTDLPTSEDAVRFATSVEAAIANLKLALDRQDDLTAAASYWVGTPP